MADQNMITVRLLPGLESIPAVRVNRQGSLLEVELESEADAITVAEGSKLLEVDSAEAIFLGLMRARRGNTVIVNLEHALDQSRLAHVQAAWNVSGKG